MDLRVAEGGAVLASGLVGDEDLVAVLEQPDILEAAPCGGVGPAALPVGGEVDAHVGRRGEHEVLRQVRLDQRAVVRLVCAVAVLDDVDAVHVRYDPPVAPESSRTGGEPDAEGHHHAALSCSSRRWMRGRSRVPARSTANASAEYQTISKATIVARRPSRAATRITVAVASRA